MSHNAKLFKNLIGHLNRLRISFYFKLNWQISVKFVACLELRCEMPAGGAPVRREVVEHDFLFKTDLKHGIECNIFKGQYRASRIKGGGAKTTENKIHWPRLYT